MAKIGPTEIRVMAIITNTLMFFLGVPKFKTPFGIATLFDVIVVCVSIMLAVFFLIETINTSKILEREDEYSRQRRAENEEKRKRRMVLREQKKMDQKQKEMSSSEREVKEPNI
jgi:uncharacterized membrane protein (DUF106 family)